ncbi:MAG: TonB-dependent receptor [Acidobacteriota bacterium]|nr:TonB-dependent receptor [Acidobacteriota bacterium]
MKTFVFQIAAAICFFISIGGQTRNSATISGTVTDPNGAFIAGAQVRLRGIVAQTVVTNKDGFYSFNNLQPGDYQLKVSAEGFATQTQSFSLSNFDQNSNFLLEIGENRLTVTAEVGQETERLNVPQAVSIIDDNEISQRATAVLAEAVEGEAGVRMQRTSPTVGGVSVRGLAGKNVSIYVDGVRYTNSAQRGGINTFFNLNEPSNLQSIEILRGASSGQYGSDALGGTVNLLTRTPVFGADTAEFRGEINTNFNSADRSFGGSTLFSYGTNRLGGAVNLAARRINNLRTAGGIDSHSALTRFLGLPSTVLFERLPDTDFTQYGGAFRLNYAPRNDSQIIFHYGRNQQDGGKRYDQLLGGDGNLIADLRNLMLDFGYLRYVKQNFAFFDSASFTVSYNSQREERVNQGGQGDLFGTVTHQYERTSATGFSFFLDKNLPKRNIFLFGGDFYSEQINSPAFTFNPRNNSTILSRPRIPDEARYRLGGVYVQNVWNAIPERLRISGALRYNIAAYRARAEDSPIVNGQKLWTDDNLRVGDFSGCLGAVIKIFKDFRVAANYSRGFRAPSMTDLGTLGLTGDGFEADYISASNLGGTIGTTADAFAVSTNLPIARQRSEYTNNFDVGLRYGNSRFETEATVFLLDLKDTITKQSLILPVGAVGKFLGDQPIIRQDANGVVFVPLSTSPVLVRANYTSARIFGFEYEAEARLTNELKFNGNFTYIRAEDAETGLPPNIEGGTPPATGFLSFRYEPSGKPFWLEFYSTLAAKQDRLSTLDLSDRRTGATRSRSQIANFFRRGACVRGLTNNPDGVCGSGDETILTLTGENLTQVQTRVLGSANSAPLFTYLPSYAVMNLRGGFRFGEKSQILWAFENIFDRPYRNPSWGIDGAGRSFSIAYRVRF